jgi:hypothetical protein
MFSFRDHLVIVTPILNAVAGGPITLGAPFRLLSGNKIALDPGASADHVPGFGELPFDIIRKSNKPKITLEGMDAVEVNAVLTRVGGIGGYKYLVSVVAQRPGVPMFTIKVLFCEWGGGGGYQGEEGGSTDKIESLGTDIHMNGKSIYARRHPR